MTAENAQSEYDKEYNCVVVTAGSAYLDIDAYACCVALKELLLLQGVNATAYSDAPCNYSVCPFLVEEGQVLRTLPTDYCGETAAYILVDVSDPGFIKDTVSPERVVAVYDHHVGFEEYWTSRIGEKAQIEFIGAAATLIYRKWKKAGLQCSMTSATARLLIAAILDNTLNLTSSNTTDEDREVFRELCRKEQIGEDWCASYFSAVQASVEADLKNALFSDLKTVRDPAILPPKIAQLCVWDAHSLLDRLPMIRQWFGTEECWMINIIDIQHRCSYFVCDHKQYQKGLEQVFGIRFEAGVAQTATAYLRKEIIKKAYTHKNI